MWRGKMIKRIGRPSARSVARSVAAVHSILFWTLLLSPLFSASSAQSSIVASSSGTWSLRVGIFNTVSGPGSDLVSDYESGLGRFHLSVIGSTGAEDTWRVDVSRTYANWPEGIKLFLRRIDGSGTSSGVITSGGTLYQEATTVPSSFCTGRGDVSDIDLMFKISGISLHIPPGVYSTSVIFTVTDL
jgi:hypothetical protein